jgi:hypothetical protein
VKEIDEINVSLQKMGSSELQIGCKLLSAFSNCFLPWLSDSFSEYLYGALFFSPQSNQPGKFKAGFDQQG